MDNNKAQQQIGKRKMFGCYLKPCVEDIMLITIKFYKTKLGKIISCQLKYINKS